MNPREGENKYKDTKKEKHKCKKREKKENKKQRNI